MGCNLNLLEMCPVSLLSPPSFYSHLPTRSLATRAIRAIMTVLTTGKQDEYRIDAGTCMNPSRDGPADNFFKDCAALAYTFPKDDRATINGIQNCEASIRCCVGTACAPHPRQQLCPGADRTAQLCSLVPDYKNSSAL